jgi:poly(hydroxyalkanoate) granule-associated protein
MQVVKLEDVRDRVKKVQDNVLTSAHNVWLAGLGAVALAEEEGRDLFTQLVDRGRDFEKRGKKEVDRVTRELEKTRETVGKRVDDLGGQLEGRVSEVLHRMGIPTRDEVRTLSRRVEELTGRVSGRIEKAVVPVERKVLHLTWTDEQWKVEAEGALRATSVHNTKDEALAAARELAQNQAPSQIVVHRMDGSVQTQYTYDPAAA